MSAIIYLDVTRMLRRITKGTPTGIDRVELEYARFTLAQRGELVVQINNQIAILPSELSEFLVKAVDRAWNDGIDILANAKRKWKVWSRGALVEQRLNEIVNRLGKSMSYPGNSGLNLSRGVTKYKKARLFHIVSDVLLLSVAKSQHLLCSGNPVRWLSCEKKDRNFWYLNVGHAGLDNEEILRQIRKLPGGRIGVYIHDILPISHPHLFSEGEADRHKNRLNNVSRYSDVVLTNSLFTARELGRYFPCISAIPLQIGTMVPRISDGYPATRRSGFVSIGTMEPRKNYLWLVREWKNFCLRHPNLVGAETLTIYGRRGWISSHDLRALERLVRSTPHIELKSGASDKEVSERLRSCRAYISAAVVEGWGMPLAESLALGTPVLASDIDAHREVTQDLAQYFELESVEDFHRCLESCFSKEAYKEMQIASAKFVPWSWEEHFKRLITALSGNKDPQAILTG